MTYYPLFQALKQRDEDLAREVEQLKHKLEELEQLAKGQGLSGLFNFKHAHVTEDGKALPNWYRKSQIQHEVYCKFPEYPYSFSWSIFFLLFCLWSGLADWVLSLLIPSLNESNWNQPI